MASLLTKVNRKIWELFLPIQLKKLNACGQNVDIKEPIIIDYSFLSIGNNSHILRDARIQNVSGTDKIRIRIGDNTGIGYRFSVLAGADVTIGNNVAVASDVFLSSGSHGIDPEIEQSYGCQPYLGQPIVIKDGAWLGEKVIVLTGVTIGEKSIVGAGSVVTRDVPDYSIAVGNPAKVIKKYNLEKHCWESVEK